ncbi:hypothetical protein ACH5RR_032897 [Cinchona calisaya]|uniref:Uncharacterized protein n=1 Tax=Cinchona calisaya TaxID=153742 RepID=A0ABD2YJF6_9GENT
MTGDILETSWLSESKGLLTKPNQSEISLHIQFLTTSEGFTEDEKQCSISCASSSIGFSDCDYIDAAYLVLNGIFWTYRPKTIDQNWRHDKFFNNNDLVKIPTLKILAYKLVVLNISNSNESTLDRAGKGMRGRGNDEEMAEMDLLTKEEGYLGRGRRWICKGGAGDEKEREGLAGEGELRGREDGEGGWS